MQRHIIGPHDLILLTGGTGFIGSRLLPTLLEGGFRNVRVLVRPCSDVARLRMMARAAPHVRIDVLRGNLLSRADCATAVRDVAVVFHLAAARGEKSFPDAFLNSVVTTRNLLEACARQPALRRFVSVSSFTVYGNAGARRRGVLDESSPTEPRPELRGDAYCFAKVNQDAVVAEYGARFGIPYVIVRPGYVYGPGNEAISGRVGIKTFGLFLHLGGSNPVPFTYVDNCADAIALAGMTADVDGEVFNVVDDDLPSSRHFLRLYKENVRRFPSLAVPRPVSFALCWAWETYSRWSEGQLPPVFNRAAWRAYWKKTHYSNERAKRRLGWTPRVSTADGLRRYFESCRRHA